MLPVRTDKRVFMLFMRARSQFFFTQHDKQNRLFHIAELFLPSIDAYIKKCPKSSFAQTKFYGCTSVVVHKQAELEHTLRVFSAFLLIFQPNCLLARAKECIKRHKSGT